MGNLYNVRSQVPKLRLEDKSFSQEGGIIRTQYEKVFKQLVGCLSIMSIPLFLRHPTNYLNASYWVLTYFDILIGSFATWTLRQV